MPVEQKRFQKPRILTDSEANTIRGKMFVGHASVEQQFQLIGHFDMTIDRLTSALITLQGCLGNVVYVYGDEGQLMASTKPNVPEYETVDFKELLGE